MCRGVVLNEQVPVLVCVWRELRFSSVDRPLSNQQQTDAVVNRLQKTKNKKNNLNLHQNRLSVMSALCTDSYERTSI